MDFKHISQSQYTNLPSHIQKQLQLEYSQVEMKQIKKKPIDFYLKQLRGEYEIVKIHELISSIGVIVSDRNKINKLDNSEIITVLIDLAKKEITPQLAILVTHILTNVALISNKITKIVVENGGIQLFGELLQSKVEKVQNDVIDGLKMISQHSILYRDMILGSDVFHILLITQTSNFQSKISCLSQLCKGSPHPKYKMLIRLIQYFCQAILNELNSDSYTYGLWALGQIEEIPGEQMVISKLILGYNILNRLMNLLDHEILFIKLETLKIIEKLVNGGIFCIDSVIQAGFIIKVPGLLQYSEDQVTEYIYRILSIIVTGSQQQMKLVLQNVQIFESLFIEDGLGKSLIRREVAQLLSNSACNSDIQDLQFLIESGIFRIYRKLLQDQQDQKLVLIVMEGVTSVLEKGNQFRENYVIELKKLELDKLIYKQVQNFKTQYVMKIYDKYANLL